MSVTRHTVKIVHYARMAADLRIDAVHLASLAPLPVNKEARAERHLRVLALHTAAKIYDELGKIQCR